MSKRNAYRIPKTKLEHIFVSPEHSHFLQQKLCDFLYRDPRHIYFSNPIIKNEERVARTNFRTDNNGQHKKYISPPLEMGDIISRNNINDRI